MPPLPPCIWVSGLPYTLPAFTALHSAISASKSSPAIFASRVPSSAVYPHWTIILGTGRYLAVSDDRSKKNPARFYELSLDLAQFQRSATPGMAGVVFHAVTVIQRPGGGPFKKNSVDPEGMRFDAVRNKIYWSNEGQRGFFGFRHPTVSEINLDGSHSRDFAIPSYYSPGRSDIGIFPGSKGIYDNLAFESLAISLDGATLYTATENGLVQDSPPANAYTGSRARVLAFDIASGRPCAEYIYEVEPVAIAPPLFGPFATNGLTDLLAIGDRQFITIERSFTPDAVIPGKAPAIPSACIMPTREKPPMFPASNPLRARALSR